MKSLPDRWMLIFLIASCTGCAPLSLHHRQSLPHGVSGGSASSLGQAQRWVASATRDADIKRSSGKCLPALRLAQMEHSCEASDIARTALTRYIQLNFHDGALSETTVSGCDGITYKVRLSPVARDWPATLFHRFDFILPVTKDQITPLRWTGWGVPCVGVNEPDRVKEPYAPRRGYRLPVTLAADTHLHGTICETDLRLINPSNTTSATIGGKPRPLAGDLEAANKATFCSPHPLLIGLKWLFAADRFSYPTRLVFTEPYDPSRIPVVLVHGLLSTQAIWGKVIRDLQSDPVILQNYQFWCFHYPTGQPIPVSALQLRTDLKSAEARYQPRRGIILIGHSMGGILSRAQASSSGGKTIVNEVFGSSAPQVIARLPESPLLRDSLIFERNRSVKRVIFICVPHQGSSMATASPIGLVIALIRLPGDLCSSFAQMGDLFSSINMKRPPTSICGLSPRSRFLNALNRRPIEVPHHTILGDRGRGDSPNSSDGVVRYKSAHLPTAASELIVPAGHGAYDHPKTIEEIKRILKAHLRASGN